MKTVSTALKNHMAGEATSLCTIWRIKRKDLQEFYFTDHDAAIVYDGHTYVPAVGYDRSALTGDAGFSVDNMDISGLLDNDQIKAEDLRAGKFNDAAVWISLVNWNDLSMGSMALRRGWLGEVHLNATGQFTTEIRGLNQALLQVLGDVYQPTCRADLGDTKCTVNIDGGGYSRTGSVAAVSSRRVFDSTISSPDSRAADAQWYVGGVLTWETGLNAGRNIEIKAWTPGSEVIELFLSMPYTIQVGDTFTIRPGCDKTAATCKAKFSNLVNFQGEPFIPGSDLVAQYIIPGT